MLGAIRLSDFPHVQYDHRMMDNGLEARKLRWDAFMDMESSTRHVFFVNCNEGLLESPPLWREKSDERVEFAWRTYCRHMEQMAWLKDDRLPFLSNITGTELFAEAFGCKVHRPPDSNPCAIPLIHDAASVAKLRVPTLEAESLSGVFEIADRLYERSGGEALMGLPDIQSPMDIAALIWDKNSFYIALLEEPAAVKDLSGMVFELLTTFLDEWFSRYGTEYIAHYPSYYMKGGLTLSEDEIGAVDQRMFDEMFYDELRELSERYGGIGIHCCANAVHQWDNLGKIPGLRLLNLHVEPEQALLHFEDHVPQWNPLAGNESPTERIGRIPPKAHAVIQMDAADVDEARRIADELWAASGRE